MSATSQTTKSPHNQQSYVVRTYPSEADLDQIIKKSSIAQKKWSNTPLSERIAIANRFLDEIKKMSDEISSELTLQMGRPITQTPSEVRGLLERGTYMLSIANASLSDVSLESTDKPGFRRYIKRVPLGVILSIAPWNYPYLIKVSTVLPAIIAGNSVLLKPSPQTPLTAERFAQAFTNAGLPNDVLQVLHLSPDLTKYVVQHPTIDFISFTGSVVGGKAIDEYAVTAKSFKGVALELGGKDPAYVRADADLEYTVPELVDGAMFNSGQSCCSIERIYVDESIYEPFVKKFADLVSKYKLGDPTHQDTNLGPVISIASAERVRKQVSDAVQAGAKTLVNEDLFPIARPGSAYVAPQVLVDVNHTMDVMMEESFGPIVGIQKVSNDEEAIKLMNDSPYGLTASVWTNASRNPASEAAFLNILEQLETGTVFLNRCDSVDPALAWTGVKNSGRGISLSKFGYDQVTKAKSVHMKIETS